MKGVKTMENNKIERVPIHLKLALTSEATAGIIDEEFKAIFDRRAESRGA